MNRGKKEIKYRDKKDKKSDAIFYVRMSEIVCLNIMRRDLSKTLTEEKKMTEVLYIVTSVWLLSNENNVKKEGTKGKIGPKIMPGHII